jgi:hypothetical protein
MRDILLRGLAVTAPLVLCANSPVHSGPAVIPYQCGETSASVVYVSGSDYVHARALVSYGGRTFEMRAAPTLYGARYRGTSGDGSTPLAWTLRGEEGILSEAPSDTSYTGTEREIARCVRVREGATQVVSSAHH